MFTRVVKLSDDDKNEIVKKVSDIVFERVKAYYGPGEYIQFKITEDVKKGLASSVSQELIGLLLALKGGK